MCGIGPRTLYDVNLSTTRVGAVPLDFVDKQTIAITIHDVFVEGATGIMYTECEVRCAAGKMRCYACSAAMGGVLNECPLVWAVCGNGWCHRALYCLRSVSV